jgi:tetratricopeptide (TPR) repeat protein
VEIEAELRRARNEFAYGNYNLAAEKLRELLYPMRLYNDDQVIETRKYLALSYYLLGKVNAAKEEFGKLLYLSPDYQLDPYTVPPPIIELFELVRSQMKPELDAIRQRQSDEQLQAATKSGYVRHVDQTMLERSELATFLPFGVGQFQNGDYGWGAVFAISELALLGVNIGAYLWATSYGPTYHDQSRQRLVQALTVAQYSSLALFGVVWSVGVFQARLSFQPLVPGPRVVHDEPVGHASIGGGLLKLRVDF